MGRIWGLFCEVWGHEIQAWLHRGNTSALSTNDECLSDDLQLTSDVPHSQEHQSEAEVPTDIGSKETGPAQPSFNFPRDPKVHKKKTGAFHKA